jgi:hypothetical protein
MTAKNTLVAYDVSLVSGEADSLYRTVADTFITVFTVGFF